ncbi:MAG: hypothetical protein LCH38_13815 [Proteobacteria bacterium]|nr:hypothetical protein [Pseudomonadota bacterium]
MERGIRLLVCLALIILGQLGVGHVTMAQVTKVVGWSPGAGSETQFKRRREGSPSLCHIRHDREVIDHDAGGQRVSVNMEINCEGRPTGGKVVFDSFIGARLLGDWKVAEVRTFAWGRKSHTRVEWLRLPRQGQALLETRARLVASRGRTVKAHLTIIAVHPAQGLLPDATWCPTNTFTCQNNNQCAPGSTCSQSCGGVCVSGN